MNKILFLLFLQVLAIACFADEYKDPATNVIYTYDPTGNRAEVKQGVRYHDFDVDSDGDIGTSGSPDAKAEIIIIDRFTIDVQRIFPTAEALLNSSGANPTDWINGNSFSSLFPCSPPSGRSY